MLIFKGGMHMAKRNRGEGTIYYSEARKQWIGQFTKTIEGEKIRKSVYGATKNEVSEKLLDLRIEMKDADFIKEKGMTLDAVAVSIGPGSYTGLRIGLSEAKGLAYALNIPLIGIDTLQIMAVSVMFNHDIDPDALFVPMIDARRMEVYTAVYDIALESHLAPTPLILDETSYREWLDYGKKLLFFGNGSDKAKELLEAHPGAQFIADINPLAIVMMALSDRAFSQQNFLDLAYSTPSYLKEFQATKPKNLI